MAETLKFPSVAETDKEYFDGSTSTSDSSEPKNTEQNNQQNAEQNSKQKNQKEQSSKQNQNQDQTNQQKNTEQKNDNPFRETSIKSLKDLGFETKDDKKFFRKIKQFEVQIELP